MICWVRKASFAASSVGSANTSSRAFVWRDWVPPSTAARASTAVRTTLFMGCCAVLIPLPSAYGIGAASHRGRARRSGPQPASPDAPGRPELRDLFEEVDVAVEEERQPGREHIGVQPPLQPELDVGEPVGEGEGEFLRRGRPCFPDVISAHADRMELGTPFRAEGHEVADQPQMGPGREDPLLLCDVLLEDVCLQRAVQDAQSTPCRSAAARKKRTRPSRGR